MTAPQSTAGKPLAGLSVLLLEDEFLIALDAESILGDLGADEIEVVNTLPAARAALESGDFQMAMFDINVNGEMSYPVAEQYAARNIPVVFASGYELREPPRLNGKAAPYLTKPYTRESIEKVVTAALLEHPAP